jgi:hypothetical protein
VQVLRRPERRVWQAMGDHHVITNCQVEQDQASSSPG